MRRLLRLWLLGIRRPLRAFDEILTIDTPVFGLFAVLITGALLTVAHYRDLQLVLPAFALGVWLLTSALVHLIVRCARRSSDIDGILNVVGFSQLVVMPAAWLVDMAVGFSRSSWIPMLHAPISVWEVALLAIGFARLLEVPNWAAVALGIVATGGVYVPLALIFI